MTEKTMSNAEVAAVFAEIADMLEIKGENRYRVLAYRRAAENIKQQARDITDIWEDEKLQEIAGVGEAIAAKIDELLSTGALEYYENLREEIPPGVVTMLTIPDVGPKTAKLLYDELGLTSIGEVEEAAREGRIRALHGMGSKSEENILKGIEIVHRLSDRILLGTALPVADELMAGLRQCPEALAVTAAGSLRRRRPTVGDIDLLVASDEPAPVVETFVNLPRVAQVQLRGETKTTVLLENGLQVDLRVLPRENYGSLLQYFTGAKEHNVQLRELSLKRDLSLSEYGFEREDGMKIACASEEEVYEMLGLDWIPPELREASGEIDAAGEGRLPKLIEPADVRSDLQMHTTWSDGAHSLEEMARAAEARGYEYILITDHSQGLGVAGGLTPERLRQQRIEIAAINEELAPFRVLAGCEVEIRREGELDLPDDVLADLDVVVASIHSGMRGDKETMTWRLIRAMRSPHVDIIAHPTGRLIGQRERIALDFEAVVVAAAETGTALEINGQPNRLDLDGEHARLAVEHGATISLGSDAHHVDGLDTMPLAVAMARRGWVEVGDVLNTLPVDELVAQMREKNG